MPIPNIMLQSTSTLCSLQPMPFDMFFSLLVWITIFLLGGQFSVSPSVKIVVGIKRKTINAGNKIRIIYFSCSILLLSYSSGNATTRFSLGYATMWVWEFCSKNGQIFGRRYSLDQRSLALFELLKQMTGSQGQLTVTTDVCVSTAIPCMQLPSMSTDKVNHCTIIINTIPYFPHVDRRWSDSFS